MNALQSIELSKRLGKMTKLNSSVVVAVGLFVSACSLLKAQTIELTYSTTGGEDGPYVTFTPITDANLTLSSGVAQTANLNLLQVTFDPQSVPASYTETLTQDLAISGSAWTPSSQAISQHVDVSVHPLAPPFDNVSIDSGSPVIFTAAGVGTLTITPGEVDVLGASGDAEPSNIATFLYQAVPEPASWALGLIAIGSLFCLRRRALRA